MRRILTLLFALAVAGLLGGCSDGPGDSGTLDLVGELAADVPAYEINPYESRPEEFCKGQIRREQFATFDEQCEEVLGLGKCVVIPENPHPGKGSFYCSLCGLKGEKMVCYMIQQD